MTFRERLANWISGGALTEARASSQQGDAAFAYTMMCEYRLRKVLHRIAAEEKPTSNATVKRMARIAREALE